MRQGGATHTVLLWYYPTLYARCAPYSEYARVIDLFLSEFAGERDDFGSTQYRRS